MPFDGFVPLATNRSGGGKMAWSLGLSQPAALPATYRIGHRRWLKPLPFQSKPNTCVVTVLVRNIEIVRIDATRAID